MKSVKVKIRKGTGVGGGDYRRATNHRASRQVHSGQRLNRSGRRATIARRVSRRNSGGLDATAHRLWQRNNVDGVLMAAVKQFETAIRYFQKENYGKAREILAQLVDKAPPEVADRARIHLRLCERRLASAVPAPKTATDNYLLGVAELNAGCPDSAAGHLEKAHKLEPKREDICYALAAAYAQQGKADAALEYLKVAIDLRPQNRFQARQDQDFQFLTGDPRFRELVGLGGSPALRTAP